MQDFSQITLHFLECIQAHLDNSRLKVFVFLFHFHGHLNLCHLNFLIEQTCLLDYLFWQLTFREKKAHFQSHAKMHAKKGLKYTIMIQISRGVYAKNLRDFESQFHYHLTLSFSLNFDISSH